MDDDPCVFCERIGLGEFDSTQGGCVIFEPLNPVTPGHLLVVPIAHEAVAATDPNLGRAAQVAASIVSTRQLEANIIINLGAGAGQTIFHLHVHIVPRQPGDGLAMPWTPH